MSLLATAADATPVIAIGGALSAVFVFAGLLVKHVMAGQSQSADQIKEWRELLAEEKEAHASAVRRRIEFEVEVEKLIGRSREADLRADTNGRRADVAEERAEKAEERVTMLTLQVAELLRKMTGGEA